MIKRENLVHEARAALKRSRAVALIGPRQCGKTTLARQLASVDSPNYLDLEDPSSLARDLLDPDVFYEELVAWFQMRTA